MTREAWVYLGQLVRALKMEGVDGRRIGEHVAEIDAHLVESAVDPVAEFGTPAQLAAELAMRPGSRRPGWVPPLWLGYAVGLLLLLIAVPLLTPWRWTATDIPVEVGAVGFSGLLYGGAVLIGWVATRTMDGRNWGSFTGSRVVVAVLGLAVVITTVTTVAGNEVLVRLPTVPYLVAAALVLPGLALMAARWSNPVRFPAHAAHLERLRRGPLAGPPLRRFDAS